MTLRVAIYARYSSDNQRDASIEDQVRICKVRAEREGWSVQKVFADHAISGASLNRPDYQKLLSAIRSGAVDVVLSESLDRISRDQEHIAGFYKQASFARTRIITLSEGEISELHIGLKGTMGALYLKDLAQKTHRGLEGRILAGRNLARAAYGYRVIKRLGDDGEPERGLREIDPEAAAIVRRIFTEYAGGASPRRIASDLNGEGVTGPGGSIWYHASIRGRPKRVDGLLRNSLYISRLVWNRHNIVKDPLTGERQRRGNDQDQLVSQDRPELQIIGDELWARVQDRLAAEQPRTRTEPAENGDHAFWEHRRPKHLLTGKVVCGCCGNTFAAHGRDYLRCRAAINGACENRASVRRTKLEAHMLEALGRQLMQPEHVAIFVEELANEWNQVIAQASAKKAAAQRELAMIERKLANLVDAIADGLRTPGLQQKLTELEARRAVLLEDAGAKVPALPALHPKLGEVYRREVEALHKAIEADDSTETREAARTLIDHVIIHPSDDGGPPGIELVGNLAAMLRTAGAVPARDSSNQAAAVLSSFVSSVKAGLGG
jgi:site-specific DNA recombinase